jgi:hypothetical protein
VTLKKTSYIDVFQFEGNEKLTGGSMLSEIKIKNPQRK